MTKMTHEQEKQLLNQYRQKLKRQNQIAAIVVAILGAAWLTLVVSKYVAILAN